jgi:homoserine kinase
MKAVKIRAYSSSANLGPGFDVAALALDAFYDEVEVFRIDGSGVKVLEISGMKGVSLRVNTGKVAVEELLRGLNLNTGIGLRIKKGVPIGKGLGSSGATAAAAIYGANLLLGSPYRPEELVDFAARAEGAIAGSPHADNVAASLLGGFVIVTSLNPYTAFSVSLPEKFSFLLAIPKIEVRKRKTKQAREALPECIPFNKFVHQSSSLAKLIVGFLCQDPKLVGEAMSSDVVVERARVKAGLIPMYKELRKAAFELGALGICVSGAGPSVLILYEGDPSSLKKGIAEVYERGGIGVEVKEARVAQGAHVVNKL